MKLVFVIKVIAGPEEVIISNEIITGGYTEIFKPLMKAVKPAETFRATCRGRYGARQNTGFAKIFQFDTKFFDLTVELSRFYVHDII